MKTFATLRITYGSAAMMTEVERQRVYDEGIRQNQSEQKRNAEEVGKDRKFRAANAATWIGPSSEIARYRGLLEKHLGYELTNADMYKLKSECDRGVCSEAYMLELAHIWKR